MVDGKTSSKLVLRSTEYPYYILRCNSKYTSSLSHTHLSPVICLPAAAAVVVAVVVVAVVDDNTVPSEHNRDTLLRKTVKFGLVVRVC